MGYMSLPLSSYLRRVVVTARASRRRRRALSLRRVSPALYHVSHRLDVAVTARADRPRDLDAIGATRRAGARDRRRDAIDRRGREVNSPKRRPGGRRAADSCISPALPLISYSTVSVLAPTERLAEPRGQVLVPFHDAKPTARGVHARLQRIRHIKGPPTILDAAGLAVLRPHNIYQRSRRSRL